MSAQAVTRTARYPVIPAGLAPAVRTLLCRLRDRQFWLVQGMILAVAGLHTFIETVGDGPLLESLHHVPVVLYVIPIVYASLHFGWEGGAFSAIWSMLLTVPNLLLFHAGGWSWGGELLETLMIPVVGIVLGLRVERERRLRWRMQHYAQQLTRAQEDERLRIARDIHDDSIQSLALIGRGLDRLLSEQPDEVSAAVILQDLRRQTQAAVDSLRRACADLRPAMLDDLGLASILQWIVRELAARTGIKTEFQLHGQPQRMEREKEIAVYRIVQEALRNVEKHAAAAHVRCRLTFGGERAVLLIEDDGKGFLAPAERDLSPRQHLGLLGMKERARLVEGEVTIRSQPTKGTRVLVSVPLSAGASAPRSGDQPDQAS